MTARLNPLGEIVLEMNPEDSLEFKAGETFVIAENTNGRLLLKKQEQTFRSYLTPPALPDGQLDLIYSQQHDSWSRVEAEAVQISAGALRGQHINDL